MKAIIEFVDDLRTVCDITIQENLTIDLTMPLTPETFKWCAERKLFVSVLINEELFEDTSYIIDTQIVPEGIETIEFL